MARKNARNGLIQAALEVVEEGGMGALSLDTVAQRAGVTKRGLLYHFPTKHALITGVHQQLAAHFEQALKEATGTALEEATLRERTQGYVEAALSAPSVGEKRFLIEASQEPEWLEPWMQVYLRWFPEDQTPIGELSKEELLCLVARMSADGAWGYLYATGSALDDANRKRLSSTILQNL
ncbi:TetR/AcrR family transcriptional regulator [Corynebacterium pelargi]|uniref:Transcriptional regulator BetI n=1 Tax=Corynebacterium pelargi TaxID=1471400 RepID=A0A410W719_9CORY|nr:TetR/AcrR family transcriptional regulator [Corynebacterium pelargi]QAU51684.1 transcriptional regulator BetI [Corynebacterium pelargi]GGG80471.1 transcriptional regulator [Corynebacterium pelargi]